MQLYANWQHLIPIDQTITKCIECMQNYVQLFPPLRFIIIISCRAKIVIFSILHTLREMLCGIC